MSDAWFERYGPSSLLTVCEPMTLRSVGRAPTASVTLAAPVLIVREWVSELVPESIEPGCDEPCCHCDETDVVIPAHREWRKTRATGYCPFKPFYGPWEKPGTSRHIRGTDVLRMTIGGVREGSENE